MPLPRRRLRHLPWIVLLLIGWIGGPLQAATPIAGTLHSTGSETLASLMLRWGEALEARHPGVRLQLQASGSSTAPPALVAGSTRLGPMSRPMSESERAAFEAAHGYAPLAVPVALDALAFFVHRDNPVVALSLAQLDAIFSDTRRCGAAVPLERWDALRPTLSGDISRYGRNSASGSHGVVRRLALCGGDFRLDVGELMGSAAVVAAVGSDPRGIGYAGLGYLRSGVRALGLVGEDGTVVRPTAEAALAGDYPLTRPLYLYLNLVPGEPWPSLERAFVELVLSAEGQAIVEELGFVALPPPRLAAIRREIGLAPP
ncbi:phosphate ABC transporter substrate-binding protein [Halomonas pacifica]|uniref:PstS family phosphate ABC transporter substrate-binding protein n=1 Tax=Bisbaumannia pacifica TaxID=77098 RepID=UPI0023581C35|nr:phosphate ABC transporter substrate-binding protein [Halomonas pacifica]MDC8804616.1 phosphate ABC transporter substrate-binding protein [Halomonas pacifica]